MFRIGIDLGGTKIAVGVVNTETFEIVSKAQVSTNLPAPPEKIVETIEHVTREAVKIANLTMKDIETIGIGTPGSVTDDGVIEFSSNFGFNNTPLKKMLEERFLKPVYIENDANCAAIGECVAGCGHGVKNFIAVTLGTGVGGGIISNGKLITGVNGAAGEIGHFVIAMDGHPCPCGRRGCFEQYASATALIRQTKAALNQDTNHESKMWELISNDIEKVNGKVPFDAMNMGDEIAKNVVDRFIEHLACGVTSLVNIFQPDIVCIGGGLSKSGDDIIVPLRKIVEIERYTRHTDKQTEIYAATLGNDAGIIGAAINIDGWRN